MAGSPKATYNASMSRSQSWALAAALSLIAAGCALAPYWLAAGRVGLGASFSGFLINPQDGFSYLAKMRQGALGAWGFLLPYASAPGEPVLLFVYYLALGHLARLLGLPLLYTYHAARLLGTLLMFLAAYALLELCLQQVRARWAAFVLILFGSGLGWLGLPFGIWGNDLLIPEAIPWFSGLTNAHFPLACAALLGLFYALLDRQGPPPRRATLAASCSLVLALVQPLALPVPALAAAGWGLLEIWRQRRVKPLMQAVRTQRDTTIIVGAALLASLPVLLYDLWITQVHPVLRSWSAQNQTPAPPLLETLLGFGLPLLLAGLALWRSPESRAPGPRLLAAWFAAGLLMVYLPFSLQRRMLLGLYFPLAGLAGLGVAWLSERGVRYLPALGLVVALGLPSNLVVAAAGVTAAARMDPGVTIRDDELQSYRWLEAHAPRRALVLAGPISGSRLPAFADVRVLYGHPFESPEADVAKALVTALYGGAEGSEQLLRSHQVDYVLYGPEERSLGSPSWLDTLQPVFRLGEVTLYKVPEQ